MELYVRSEINRMITIIIICENFYYRNGTIPVPVPVPQFPVFSFTNPLLYCRANDCSTVLYYPTTIPTLSLDTIFKFIGLPVLTYLYYI